MKVKIIRHSAGSSNRFTNSHYGETFTVRPSSRYEDMWAVSEGEHFNCLILKDCTEILTESVTFQPKSGMVCVTEYGTLGLFVGINDNDLRILWFLSQSASYNGVAYRITHISFAPKLLDGRITKIYKGIGKDSEYTQGFNIGKYIREEDLIWKYEPPPKEPMVLTMADIAQKFNCPPAVEIVIKDYVKISK